MESGLAPRSKVEIQATAAEKRARKNETAQAREEIATERARKRAEAVRLLAELDAERDEEERAEKESFERVARATDKIGHEEVGEQDNEDDDEAGREMAVEVDGEDGIDVGHGAPKVSAYFSRVCYVDPRGSR